LSRTPSRADRFAPPAKPAGKSWFFSTRLDLLVMANVLWPLVALLVWLTWTHPAHEPLSFWRTYFLVTPHRWVTLVLVFFDRNRFEKNSRLFVGLALAAVVACAIAYLGYGVQGVMVLIAIDFLWNAWHYASQHAGIYRIYGRMSRPERAGGEMEKLAIRVFVSYVFFRTLGVIVMQAFDTPTFGWIKQLAKDPALLWMDLAVLAIPLGLLLRDLRGFKSIAKGQLVYLVSFGTIYSLILIGLRARAGGVAGLEPAILALFFGTAVFHSTEYLAIVSWTATRTKNPRGVIRHLAPRWMAFLICFMLVLGLTSLLLIKSEWAQPYKLFQIWIVLNLCVSMLHYAYDGIIWRAPSKQRA
jgi:hypothetical protein